MSTPDHCREMTFGEAIREALREEMKRDERVFIIGEDVAEADLRPLAGEQPRLDGAHTPGASADKSNLSCQSHNLLRPRQSFWCWQLRLGHIKRFPAAKINAFNQHIPISIISFDLVKPKWSGS